MYEPLAYWHVDKADIRLRVLRRFVALIDLETHRDSSTEEIIKTCIALLPALQITAKERISLKEAILKQNIPVWTEAMELVVNELTTLDAREVHMVSLGCGHESLFEKSVDGRIRASLPGVRLNWLGIDVGDYRSPTSFFRNYEFKIIHPEDGIAYRTLIKKDGPVFLVGSWAYHHIGIDFDVFYKRCAGLARAMLVEEPTTKEKWSSAEYRIMRIAYDILGNVIMSLSWAAEFSGDPSKFKVRYIFEEELPTSSSSIPIPNLIPETSVIILRPVSAT